MADILVLCAHPHLELSRVNRRLMRAAATLPPLRVEVHDLYAAYPDYAIDVEAEQARLADARLVVWQHPIHWYTMPALMKLWVEEVLAYGWAYGPGGRALQDKDLWLVASTGGPPESYHPAGYNRYFFDAFLPGYEQTAALCGMRFVPPMLLHAAHRADDAQIDAHATVYAERLARYPDWPELAELEAPDACAVPADTRPDTAAAGTA